jgi:hypothetical protein
MPSIAQPADRDFEITFADLAHAQLRDKAPALLDYLLGFQVIDSNEEQTHGVGVLGFKIGEQMLFVPSFFLNGELKQNLIYIKNQDLFVPLQDNWVTYLLNRRPFIMGEGEPQKEQQLGIMQPNLATLSNTISGGNPASLFSTRQANWEPWAAGAERMFDKLDERYLDLLDLPTFLQKTANYGTSVHLARTMRDDPDFANTVLRFHELKTLMHKPAVQKKREKSAAAPRRRTYPVKRSSILFDMAEDVRNSHPGLVNVYHGAPQRLMSDADCEQLLRGGVVVKDARAKANQAYHSDEGTKLQNPAEPGIYQLLLADGEYVDAFIMPGPVAVGKGYARAALVVDTDSKNFSYNWPENLWCKPLDKPGNDLPEYATMPGTKAVKELKVGDIATIIATNGRSTVAFEVKRKVSGQDGQVELYVDPQLVDPGTKPRALPEVANAEDITQFGQGDRLPFVGDVDRNSSNDPTREEPTSPKSFPELSHLVITNDHRGLRVVGNTLFVSDEAKALTLKTGDGFETWGLSDPSSLLDVEANLLKAGAEQFTMFCRPEGVYVDNVGPFNRVQIITSLVKDAGLRANEALSIVDGLKLGKRVRFIVKNNIGYAPPIPEPPMGYDDYSGAMEQYPQDETLPIDMGVGQDVQGYLGKPEKQQVMEAAQTGQKEIFDTSAIASLVRTSDSDDMITQYLSDIILGLDRVNRILFMYYWLNEQFRDRFGQENLGELEDQLKNVGKSLGDLVIFLKQRPVEGSPNFDAMEVRMGAR